tara:strand:- start:941 stop:1249 length:309 start_codon:yes stop_codon:yes gene_type:complete
MRKKNWIEFNNDHNKDHKNKEQVDSIKSHKITIHTEKKGKKGKIITVVSGFGSGNSSKLLILLKNLKVYCGTGGTLNNNLIQLQGDMQNKVRDFLRKDGYQI